MGSGCVSSTNTGFGSSFQKIPDTGVRYTGPAIPSLGICTGDTLDEIEAIILNKLLEYAQGKGIFISGIDLTVCNLFINDIKCCNATGPKELDELIRIIFDALCRLYTDLEDVKVKLTDLLTGPYNVSCITGLPANPTLKQIIQQLLIEFCALKLQVSNLQTQVNNLTTTLPTTIGNFLLNAINSCQTGGLTKSGSGASAQITFKGFVPVGGIMPFAGSLSGFDSSGLGVTNGPMCGWAICNGNNGTVNMLGLVPVGATTMPNGTPPIGGMALPYNSVSGQYNVTLSAAQCAMPAHSHTISDPGHSHKIRFGSDNGPNPGSIPNYQKWDGDNLTANFDGTPPNDGNTGGGTGNVRMRIVTNTTGITINSVGGSSASSGHDNMMPYRALYYIQRIS